jgi:hypothetical protein
MTQKGYYFIRLYVCQSNGWHRNCFQPRKCPKCEKGNLDERTKRLETSAGQKKGSACMVVEKGYNRVLYTYLQRKSSGLLLAMSW